MFFLVSLSSSAGNIHALKLQADVSDSTPKLKRVFFIVSVSASSSSLFFDVK